jgi:integrase
MAIERRGNQWYYRFQFRREEYREPTGLDATRENMALAKEREKQRKAELQLGKVRMQQSVPFDLAVAQFLNWCESVEYRSKRNTYLRLKTSLASAVEYFSARNVDELDPTHFEDYKTWRATEHRVKDITIRHDLYALSLFFRKFAVKRGWAAVNPVREVTKPSDADAIRIHILTPEEETVYFAEAARNRNLYDLARLMLLQGCRPEEILSMRPGDVDFDRNVMRVSGKSRAGRRELEMTSESAAILLPRVQRAGIWLFPSPRKPGRHIVKLDNAQTQACLDAQVSFVLYDLRHTFATRQLTEVGTDLGTVADLLGHSGLRVVARYIHPRAKSKSEAMKKYDRMLRAPLKAVK